MQVENYIPAIKWLKNYKSSYLYFDLISGINLGVSMIPKAMAYALVAGLPPIYGLYASFIAPLVGILFGSNRLLFTGPVGVMTVLVFSSLSSLAEPESQQYIGMAALLSLIVGFIMLVIALSRMTSLLNLISHSAVLGFVNAAALIIVATQLKYILGIDIPHEEYVVMTFLEIFKGLLRADPIVFGLSILGFVSMVLVHRKRPTWPAVIIVLLPVTLLVYLIGPIERGIELVGSLPKGLPSPELPLAGFSYIGTLIGSAAVIAVVGMTETYSISKIVSYNTKQKVDYNQEFTGQGLANIATSLFQGYPVCGSFSGTSVNWSSGARTGMSLIIFSFLALLSITVLTPLFYYLPKFMLAVIVIMAVIKLFKPKQLLEIYRINRADGVVAIITFAVALLAKPDYGIIVGVALALGIHVWKTMHTSVYVMTKDKKTGYFITHPETRDTGCEQITILKPEGPFIYVNAEHLRDSILKLVANQKRLKYMVLDMAAVYYMDSSGAEAFRDMVEELEHSGISIAIIHTEEEVLKTMNAAGLMQHIKTFKTKKDAIEGAMDYMDKKICEECDNKIFTACQEE